MAPRNKTSALFIPAKTLPHRSGRGPVNPPSTKKIPQGHDLQDADCVEREQKRAGPSSLTKNNETKAESQEPVDGVDKRKSIHEADEKHSRLSIQDKGKGNMSTVMELATTEATATIETIIEASVLQEASLVKEQERIQALAAPLVVLEDQNDILWELMEFFNSAPPLSAPPVQPSTPKAALVPSVLSQVPTSPQALPSLSTSPSPSSSPSNSDADYDGKRGTMSSVWSYADDPMWRSGRSFLQKPAFSIYKPNPWTEPNHELNSIMTVEIEDGAFDEALWIRDQYDTNVAFAANCKFEHPTNRPSANPFAPLQNPLQSTSNARGNTAADFYLNRDAIQKDLQEERPEWILSAYGPGRDAPEQLWGGILEQSPEEMRLHAMTCEAAGNLQGALSDFEMLKSKAVEKISAAYSDPDAAINWIMSALNKQPNRLNLVANNMDGQFAVGKRPVGFGATSDFSMPPTNANPFGQPSALAQNANPFKSGTAGFGQPSALGQAPNAFDQPAAMGSSSGFGQTSALGQKPSAFGAPSTLGTQNAFAQGTGFGQASSLGPKPNPFGAPSAFAQTNQTAQGTAFGQPSQPTPGGPFGQPSQLGATPSAFNNATASSAPSASPFNAFAKNNNSSSSINPFAAAATSSTSNVFGQNAQQSSSPFAQPQQAPTTEVSMGSATPTTNTFPATGNPSTTAGPFGQPQQAPTNTFGQPATANPFGQTQQPAQQKPNPFAPAAGIASQPASSTIGIESSSTKGPYGPNASRQHPAVASYAVKDPATGQLRSFKNRQVVYKEIDGKPTPVMQNMDGSFTKIWFPDGAPQYYPDTEPDREYTDAEKTIWQGFQQTGQFQLAATGGGGMPLAPPMRECVQWDF